MLCFFVFLKKKVKLLKGLFVFLDDFFLEEVANLPDLGWASLRGQITPAPLGAPLGTASRVCVDTHDHDDLTLVEIYSNLNSFPNLIHSLDLMSSPRSSKRITVLKLMELIAGVKLIELIEIAELIE